MGRFSYSNLKNHIGDAIITMSVFTQFPQLTSPGSKSYVWLLNECSIEGNLCMWKKKIPFLLCEARKIHGLPQNATTTSVPYYPGSSGYCGDLPKTIHIGGKKISISILLKTWLENFRTTGYKVSIFLFRPQCITSISLQVCIPLGGTLFQISP